MGHRANYMVGRISREWERGLGCGKGRGRPIRFNLFSAKLLRTRSALFLRDQSESKRERKTRLIFFATLLGEKHKHEWGDFQPRDSREKTRGKETFRQRIGPVSIRPCSHNVRQRSSLLSQPLPKLSLSSVPANAAAKAAAAAATSGSSSSSN